MADLESTREEESDDTEYVMHCTTYLSPLTRSTSINVEHVTTCCHII